MSDQKIVPGHVGYSPDYRSAKPDADLTSKAYALTPTETPRDWPAFWRSLPPREQWEAAKAMPKIAGPWTATPGYEPAIYQRDALHGAKVEGMTAAFDDAPAGFTEVRVAWGSDWVKVPDRASADDALRAAGWILVDPEPEDGGRG